MVWSVRQLPQRWAHANPIIACFSTKVGAAKIILPICLHRSIVILCAWPVQTSSALKHQPISSWIENRKSDPSTTKLISAWTLQRLWKIDLGILRLLTCVIQRQVHSSMAPVNGTKYLTLEPTSTGSTARSIQNSMRPNRLSSLRYMTKRRSKNDLLQRTTNLIRRLITQPKKQRSATNGKNKNVSALQMWLWSGKSRWRGLPTMLIRGRVKLKGSITIIGTESSYGTILSSCRSIAQPPLPISLTMILRVSQPVHPTPIWTETNHQKQPLFQSRGTTRQAPPLTKMSTIPGRRPVLSAQLWTIQSKKRKRAAL